MSEKKTKKQKTTPLVQTIVVAVLALAAVIALIFILGSKPVESARSSSNEVFRPTAEFEQE